MFVYIFFKSEQKHLVILYVRRAWVQLWNMKCGLKWRSRVTVTCHVSQH